MHVLKDYKVYFIGVDLPIEVLEAREKARATSPAGHARTHYKTVHSHGQYDLIVDTSKLSTQECVAQIKQLVETTTPHAFKKLEKQLL